MTNYFVGQKLWIFKDVTNSNFISTRNIIKINPVVYEIENDNDDYHLDNFQLIIMSFGDPVYENS